MTTRRRPPLVLVATMVPLAASVVLAVVPFDALFTGHRPLVWAAGAVGLAVAVGLGLRGRSPLVAAAAHVAAFFAYLCFAVFRVGSPSPSKLAAVWEAAASAWSQLLGTTPPTVPTPRLAVVPVVVAWLAGLIGTELASRTRWASPLIVAPLAAYTTALAFTGRQPPSSIVLPAGIIGLCLVVVLVRSQRTTSGAARPASSAADVAGPATGVSASAGRLVGGMVSVAILGAIGAVAAVTIPVTPEARRVDLHERYVPPVDIDEAISPLSRVKGQLNDTSDVPLFSVRLSGIPAGLEIDRIPVALLDQYDGAVWGTRARFAPAGDGPTPGPASAVTTASVNQHYELGTYPSSFVPALERPSQVFGSDLAFDTTGGMVAARIRPPKGFSYDVASPVPLPTEDQLRAARPGNDVTVDQLSLPPPEGWPLQIRRFAESLPPADTNRYALLEALEEQLRSDEFGYDPQAEAGHSFAALTTLLAPLGPASSDERRGRVGSAEQFAAAFAVVARARGIASRVVVGYRIDPELAREGALISVRPSAAHAWAEAWLRNVGWVAFDPTRPTPRQPQAPAAPPPEAATSSGPAASAAVAGTGPVLAAPTTPAPPPRSRRSPLWYLGIAAGFLLLFPFAVVAANAVRRRRRRQGTAPARALGAWAQTREDLRSFGFAIVPSMTIADAAAVLDREQQPALAAPLFAALRPIVDLALYSNGGPDENAAAVAWDANADVRSVLRRQSTRKRRMVAAFDPRPILRSLKERAARRRAVQLTARVRALLPKAKAPA